MEQFPVMYLIMTYIHTSAHIWYIDGVHNRCWKCPPSSCWHNSTRLLIFHDMRLNIVALIPFIACEIAYLRSSSVRGLSLYAISFKWLHTHTHTHTHAHTQNHLPGLDQANVVAKYL